MTEPQDKPRIIYSRKNIRKIQEEALQVTTCAWMVRTDSIENAPTEQDISLSDFPTIFAPAGANQITTRKLRTIMEVYNDPTRSAMLDVHIAWFGLFVASRMVLELEYFEPISETIFISFDLNKWDDYLTRLVLHERLMISFKQPPAHNQRQRAIPIGPDDDPDLVALFPPRKIQAELAELLLLWLQYRFNDTLKGGAP